MGLDGLNLIILKIVLKPNIFLLGFEILNWDLLLLPRPLKLKKIKYWESNILKILMHVLIRDLKCVFLMNKNGAGMFNYLKIIFKNCLF